MRILLISALFFLSACSTFESAQSQAKKRLAIDYSVENTYFSQLDEEHIFRANLSFFQKEISGLLVIKKTAENAHRVVLTSDFGNTLFDFSIFQSAPYQVNYVMPDLNKKMILNFMAKDFQILLNQHFTMTEKSTNDSLTIYQGKFGKKYMNILVNSATNHLQEIIQSNKRKPKVRFVFETAQEESVTIQHENLPIKMIFNKIDF